MKKVLLLSLSLALGFSAFAQQRVAKNDVRMSQASAKKVVMGKEASSTEAAVFTPRTAQSVVVNRDSDMTTCESMWSFYDLQSNHYISNRMMQWADGSVAMTATMSHQANTTNTDRGTGYFFFPQGEFPEGEEPSEWEPDSRFEPYKTGWPSIAQWGAEGEVVLCHGNGGLQCFAREKAGQGEWEQLSTLPLCPPGYPYAGESDAYATWPRIATTGDNHNIIGGVAAIQHSISSDEAVTHDVFFRSEDGINWTMTFGPLADLGLGYETGYFSADDYCIAANGHNVAILYSGSMTNSVWMFKSTDDGLTWEPTRVWEDPYEGADLNDPEFFYEDTLFRPMNGAIAIDNNGVAHVALNTFEMIRTEENEPGYYSYWSGRPVDGILYWNDTREAPIADTYHPEFEGNEHLAGPNPFHAARLWWPIPGESGYVQMQNDSTKWIGMIPMFYDESGSMISFENDNFFHESDYVQRFYGASGHPALSIDPYGNIACAYSSPCTFRTSESGKYLRSIFVSYYNVDKGYWDQMIDDVTDPEISFSFVANENIFTVSVLNTVNPGEFWFGYQADDTPGLYIPSNSSQTSPTENGMWVVKVTPDQEYYSAPENHDAINPMTSTRIYPNPVVDQMNIEVNASQASEMSISVYNLMGQKVMDKNVSVNTGINTTSLSTSSLSSGVYFVTVKANGFSNTMKFVVK